MRNELEPQHGTPRNGGNGTCVGTVVPKVFYNKRKSPKTCKGVDDDVAKYEIVACRWGDYSIFRRALS
jgi:hypothetical protein